MSRLDVAAIRKDFPFFESTDLIYLDNSATSQRPKVVLDAVNDYYYHFKLRSLYHFCKSNISLTFYKAIFLIKLICRNV